MGDFLCGLYKYPENVFIKVIFLNYHLYVISIHLKKPIHMSELPLCQIRLSLLIYYLHKKPTLKVFFQ